MQIPIGEEEKLEGVIDLLKMKAYYFEGQMGIDVREDEVPENLKAEAEKLRSELVEKAVEDDDVLTNDYLEGKEIPIDVIKGAIRKSTIANKFVPVFTGSALKNKGVQLVLDGVVDYLPSPLDIPPVKGIDPKTEEEIERKASDDEPFAALAFKLQTDPFVGQLTYFRVYSGTLESGSYVYNTTTGNKERIGRILRMHANSREEVKKVFTGEIAAAVGLKDTRTSDTLSDETNQIVLERIEFSEPVVNLKIEQKTKADQEKMGIALKKHSDEDPKFRDRKSVEEGKSVELGGGRCSQKKKERQYS